MQLKKLIVFTVLFVLSLSLNAQCFSFARSACKSNLGEYVHDGNYNATMLSEGEKAELYKTFFKGQKYRLAICKIKDLPPIHFRITDQDGKVYYDNEDHDYTLTWDFQMESTQMLIVEMKVLEREEQDGEIISGCVAVLFGIENNKKKKK